MAQAVATIRITSKSQKWRYHCPNNHMNYDTTNNHFWCRSCSHQHGSDPEHWELYDTKADELVPRDRIELAI